MKEAGVGDVHFMLFVLISFALGSQRKPSLQWNMGFSFVCLGEVASAGERPITTRPGYLHFLI